MYIPYGTEWYPYLTRRLAERPANLWFFLSNLVRTRDEPRRRRRSRFLGGGKMGEALISGLIRSGGRTADEIMVTNRREERARELAGKYGVTATLDNAEAARWANVLVLMAKPQDMEVLLEQIREHVTTDDLVISFAAGIRTSFVEKHLPDDVPVVRVMSNVPVMVDEAMSVVAAGRHADDEHLAIAEELLGYVGKVLRLKETHLDAVTATSGSGPAYFFLLAEAMIEACILLGLSRDVATELIIQTMLGLGEDAARHGQAPGGAPRDGDLARRHDDRGDPPPRGGRRARRVPERDRRGASSGARSSRRAATTTRTESDRGRWDAAI